MKIELHNLIDSAFPEFHSMFMFSSGIHIPSSYAILEVCSTPVEVLNTRVDKLTNILYNASKGKFNRDKATLLKKLAASSIVSHSDALSFEIKLLIEDLSNIKKK